MRLYLHAGKVWRSHQLNREKGVERVEDPSRVQGRALPESRGRASGEVVIMENWLLNLIWVYLLAVNTLAFSLMGIDKRRAKRGAWRIAERTLFLPVVLFGSLGGTLGMFCFHHKTKHWYFRYGFPLLLVVQLLLLGAGVYLLLR